MLVTEWKECEGTEFYTWRQSKGTIGEKLEGSLNRISVDPKDCKTTVNFYTARSMLANKIQLCKVRILN